MFKQVHIRSVQSLMLTRCAARPSICTRLHPRRPLRPRFLSAKRGPEPQQSSASASPTATATATARPPTSRKWQLYVVIGLVGFTIGSWYRIIWLRKSPDSFEPFELISKEPVSSTASIFTIKPNTQRHLAWSAAWKEAIWNVQFKQPQLQIVRAYTPLPPDPTDELDPDETETLRFLIRKDARGGEMSSYLHRLPVGSTIELRGPQIEYEIGKHVRNVIFIAGGTGIAPAMQVAHAMFAGLSERQKKEKRLHILWANRMREDCAGANMNDAATTPTATANAESRSWSWSSLLSSSAKIANDTAASMDKGHEQANPIVEQLNNLKLQHGGNISVSYYVDEEKTYIHSGTIEHALSSLKNTPGPEKTQIIISGPPGFITYLAGPKVWQDGEEKQGPLGGRLAQVLGKEGRNDVKVWKV